MKALAVRCRVCRLRIVERVIGGQHMNTVAGRRADRDHEAEPDRSAAERN